METANGTRWQPAATDREAAGPANDLEQEQRREKWRYFAAAVGPRLAGARLDTFRLHGDPDCRRRQQVALAAIQECASNLRENIRHGRGVLIYGPVGSGKDHLAVSVARVAILDLGATARWVSGPVLYRTAREAMGRGETDLVERLVRPHVLILSDPFPAVGDLSAYQWQTLYDVVDARYSRRRPTITTANVASLDDLDRRLTPAISDRLRADALVVETRWPSYRSER